MKTETPESMRICDELVERFPDARYGPAHIVVEDHNLEDRWIIDVLRDVDKLIARLNAAGKASWYERELDASDLEELNATRATLIELLAMTEKDRCWWQEE